ncbi:LOW QUALITY PROTEIN: protein CREG2 [Rhynchonycteris naso]
MSVHHGLRLTQPRTSLSWMLCCSALLRTGGYVIVSSVSWAVPNEVDKELDSASTEETMSPLLGLSSIWQQRFPTSAHKEDPHLQTTSSTARALSRSAPWGMFSYVRESGTLYPGTARFLAHASVWGCLATVSTQKIPGLLLGNYPISDGPLNNSTGIPFFYVIRKDSMLANVMKNSMASLLLLELGGEFCRNNIIDPEDPHCTRLTLASQVITVSPQEAEFAKQAMFSRHLIMRKWPCQYEWFFMKMRIEHIWLQKWYREVSGISREEYFKAVPRNA